MFQSWDQPFLFQKLFFSALKQLTLFIKLQTGTDSSRRLFWLSSLFSLAFQDSRKITMQIYQAQSLEHNTPSDSANRQQHTMKKLPSKCSFSVVVLVSLFSIFPWSLNGYYATGLTLLLTKTHTQTPGNTNLTCWIYPYLGQWENSLVLMILSSLTKVQYSDKIPQFGWLIPESWKSSAWKSYFFLAPPSFFSLLHYLAAKLPGIIRIFYGK